MKSSAILTPKKLDQAIEKAFHLPYWQLNARQTCDIELLLNGAFDPLHGFLGKADYQSVVNDMRLADGRLWPMPITLDIPESFAESLNTGDQIALRDPEHFAVAVIEVQEIWKPDLQAEAEKTFGTQDQKHPAVSYLFRSTNPVYIGGPLQAIELPRHIDYVKYRHTPKTLRAIFKRKKWEKNYCFSDAKPLASCTYRIDQRSIKKRRCTFINPPDCGY